MKTIQHKFVEFIPDVLEDGILYISMEYRTGVHKCICGCGNKVVTPITPTDWKITYDGRTVSLFPSIGNWSFECKSHYWITNNQIRMASIWSEKKIKKGRSKDSGKKKRFFGRNKSNL
jgi:Family of unknown function (DUF6527)